MRRTLIAPLASLTALALTSPAMSDTLFRCQNGTSVALYEAGREMRINGHTDRFSIALPLAHAYGNSSVRTPRRFYEEDGTCTPELAPCVEYRFPAGGPDTVTYQLEATSPVVNCVPEPERRGSLY